MNGITASRVKQVRTSRGLTQTELAKMINTRPATVSDIENGNRQVGRWLAPLSQALGVTADYLLGLTDHPRKPDIDVISRLPEDRRVVVTMLVDWLAEN